MILNQTLDQVKACNSRIYNIAANYHFLESLADFLLNKFSIEKIAKLKILLPNRRLVRNFQLILSKKITNHTSSAKLPKIKAISDLNLDDFIDNFANHNDLNLISRIEEITNQLTKIKIESEIENLLFLSKKIKDWQEITKFFGGNFSNSEALNIASNLLDLFNESQKEAIDLEDLLKIDDSEDSLHRQFILQFLQQFYFEIKNSLLKNNLTSKTLYQNLIIDQFSDFIKEFGHFDPIIIAGSTGSIKSTKKLIKTILELENGQVVIYGFDQEFRKNANSLNQESHPQFMINSLIDYLKINDNHIIEIQNDQYLLSSKTRKKLIEMAMLPSDEIIKWQDFSSQIDDLNQMALSLKNISLINARNEIEESKIIAIALKEAEIAGKKAALITNDHNLIYMVKLELQKFKIQFNDATNIGIFHSKLINFILLILELVNDYDSNKFLTLLKHDLCFFSAKEFDQELNLFELEIIRKAKVSNDFKGIKIAIDNLEDHNLSMSLANNFGIIFNLFSKLESLLKTSPSLSNFTKQLIVVIENLSKKNFVEILDQEDASQEISDFFTNLTNQNSRAHLITTDQQDILQLFKILFAKISYFEKSSLAQPNCLIQILPTIEARQLNHDLTIISSLNEGSFPEISSENWLGKKIKKDLKIDKSSKQIGINAYDFCNHFCNSRVILTRSISSNNSPTTPSRFILKLQSLAKKINLDFDDGAIYLQAFNQMNKAQLPDSNIAISRPNPKPAIEYRPINYAITDISKLIHDPYSIYAKKILKLKPLNKIDYEGANAEFGSFVHEVLEKFIKQPDQEINEFVKKAKKIFLKYFPNQELELIWWPKFENIFSSFLDHELELITSSNYVEIAVKLILDISHKQIIINGKIDRIIFDQNNLARIIDYKTGYCPTKNEVISGLEPQLTISALALIEGQNLSLPKLSLEKIANLEYWKLSFGKENEYNKIFKDPESLDQTTKATKIMLQDLFNYFFNQPNLNGYISCYDQELYQENEYKYLARIDEWSL